MYLTIEKYEDAAEVPSLKVSRCEGKTITILFE
jgi:hypothetical protein